MTARMRRSKRPVLHRKRAIAFDGDYVGSATFPMGTQPLLVKVVNGVGNGVWKHALCSSVVKFTLTIMPDRTAVLSIVGFTPQCAAATFSYRSRVDDNNRVSFSFTGSAGVAGQVVLTRS